MERPWGGGDFGRRVVSVALRRVLGSTASTRSARPTCSSRRFGKLRASPMGTAWDKWACCSRLDTSRRGCSRDFRGRRGLSVRLRGCTRSQVTPGHGSHTAFSTTWDRIRPASPARPRNPIALSDRSRRSYPRLRRRLPYLTSLPMSLRRCLPHPFQRHLPTNAQPYRRPQRRLPANFRRSCPRCRLLRRSCPRCRLLRRCRPRCLLLGLCRRDRKSRRNRKPHLPHRFRSCHRYPNRICPSCLPHPRPPRPLRSHPPYRPLLRDSLQACQPDLRPHRSQFDRRSSRRVRRPNQTPEASWIERRTWGWLAQ
jgi:hypothetical protein